MRSSRRLLSLLAIAARPSRAAFVAAPAFQQQQQPPSSRGLASRVSQAARACATEAPAGTRTRFAPSPTGSLHVGGARTALFAWLKAKKEGGDFIVRVEDTDTARSTRESEEEVLKDLEWLGLKWEEGPVVGGDKGPYRQSERMTTGLYQELAQQLMDAGHAYPCFCTQEELDKKRAAAEALGENPQYDGTWRDADPAEVKAKMDAGEPYTVRFKVPRGKKVTIQDQVRGEVTWDVQATVGDFILLRSGGMPVYNFCVAVDDATMQVSDVIRAEEHLTNTVRQVLILEALGFVVPSYAHLALVLGEDRSKLSKRHGATSVNQFRLEGFLPQASLRPSSEAPPTPLPASLLPLPLLSSLCQERECAPSALRVSPNLDQSRPISAHALWRPSLGPPRPSALPPLALLRPAPRAQAMINYLCLLGWNDGTDQEIYTVDELVEAFTLDRITKSPAVFDQKKLRWINGQHLRALPEEELSALLTAQFGEAKTLVVDAPSAAAFVGAVSKMVAEKVELVNDAEPLVRDALAYPLAETLASDAAKAFVDDASVLEVGNAVLAAHKAGELPALDANDFEGSWKKWVKAAGKELGRKGKGLFMPLRIVMTGRMAGPDIPAQLMVLGKADAALQLGGDDAMAVVSLAERMEALEAALSALPAPEPAAA